MAMENESQPFRISVGGMKENKTYFIFNSLFLIKYQNTLNQITFHGKEIKCNR